MLHPCSMYVYVYMFIECTQFLHAISFSSFFSDHDGLKLVFTYGQELMTCYEGAYESNRIST